MIRFTRALCAPMFVAAALIALPVTAFAAADIAKLTGDATAGNAEAQFELGNAYLKGDGVTADPTQAAKWYLMAAEQGFTQAQVQMAMKYAHGNGVPVDHVEADKWIVLASRTDKHNQALQIMLENHFTSEEINHGHLAADQWQAQHNAAPKPAA
jgi:TPR repeat protein